MRRSRTLAVVSVLAMAAGVMAVSGRAAAAANGKIAFDRKLPGAGANFEVMSANPDGTGTVNLTKAAGVDEQPAWSPDGTRIAFTSNRTGNFEIFVMDADGTHQGQLVTHPGTFDWRPTWSPDGTRIAFLREGQGEQAIYVVPVSSGAPVKKLFDGGWDPDWSPTGNLIAFTSFQPGDTSPEIYTIHANGTQLRRLTRNARIDDHVDWSPDGTMLAYCSFVMDREQEKDQAVYTIHADGTHPTRVSGSKVGQEPAWSPDGKRIAYQGHAGSNWDIYTMPAGGGRASRVTTSSAVDEEPDWQPIPAHRRTVTLKLTVGPRAFVASGRVTVPDGFGACAASVRVNVQRKAGGSWVTVGSAATDATGHYLRKVARTSGSYRAVAPKTLLAHALCRKATSPLAQG